MMATVTKKVSSEIVTEAAGAVVVNKGSTLSKQTIPDEVDLAQE